MRGSAKRIGVRLVIGALLLLPVLVAPGPPGAQATPVVGYQEFEFEMRWQQLLSFSAPDQWTCEVEPYPGLSRATVLHCTPPSHFLCAGADVHGYVHGTPNTHLEAYAMCATLPGGGFGTQCRTQVDPIPRLEGTCNRSTPGQETDTHHIACAFDEGLITTFRFQVTVTCGFEAEPWPPR